MINNTILRFWDICMFVNEITQINEVQGPWTVVTPPGSRQSYLVHTATGNTVPTAFKAPGPARQVADELNKKAAAATTTAGEVEKIAKSQGTTTVKADPKKLNFLQKMGKFAAAKGYTGIGKTVSAAGDKLDKGKTTTGADTKYKDAKAELDAEKKPSWLKKARVGLLRIFQSTVLGRAVFAIISADRIVYNLDGYLIEYQKAGCKENNNTMYWRTALADELVQLITGFLLAGVTTLASIKVITALFAAIPVAGWVVATIGIISGGVLTYFLTKLAQNVGFMQSIADYIAATMLTPRALTSVMKPVCENITESQWQENLLEAEQLHEEKISKIKKDAKQAVVKMFADDPKMKKIVQFAMKKDPEADPRRSL